MSDTDKVHALGFNHVALEVGDIDAAIEFYGKIFEVKLRGRGPRMAFIDMGDQFLAIAQTDEEHRDAERHFGLVVDDQAKALQAAKAAGAEFVGGTHNDFLDPWGNRIQVVEYGKIQFTKTGPVLEAMGLGDLKKTDQALAELREKGIDIE